MTSSRARLRVAGSLRPGLLVTAVVAIVLGILGMHGVDAHGVTALGATVQSEVSTDVAAGHAADHVIGHADSRAVGGADSHDGGGTSDTGGMVMWCMAMLAAAVGLLALLVRRGRPAAVWAVLPRAGDSRRALPVPMRVGTGPPASWRFSVIRC